MSGQEKLEDSRLLESISQQLNLYDNLFPQVESKELQVLFALIRIYLARCDNPQLKRKQITINPEIMKRLYVTYFDPFTTPVSRSLKEGLVSRLNSIRKYRITNPEVVRRTLVTCLYQEKTKPYTKQKIYLDAFMKNAGKSFTEIARQLGVTPQAVSQAYRSLQRSDMFRLYGQINYPTFNLKHIVAFFTLLREYRRNSDYLRRLFLDNLPFTSNLNLDVYEGTSWASFAIPNQGRELREFVDSLEGLSGEVFREIKICELKSFSTGSNLEFFDGKHWFFDPQLWAYGFFEFVKENKEILRKAVEFHYSEQQIRFDKVDFLAATMLAANPLMSHYEIKKRLREFGYEVSRPKITRRVKKLISSSQDLGKNAQDGAKPVVYPYMAYWGLGLNNLSAYLIECDEDQIDEICYAANYLPYYFLYRTGRGVLLSIKSTVDDAAKINYMMKGIDEIRVVTYSNRFENIGGRTLTHLYELWDETKQRWICPKDELNFVKRYELLQ